MGCCEPLAIETALIKFSAILQSAVRRLREEATA